VLDCVRTDIQPLESLAESERHRQRARRGHRFNQVAVLGLNREFSKFIEDVVDIQRSLRWKCTKIAPAASSESHGNGGNVPATHILRLRGRALLSAANRLPLTQLLE
jgi:hypothetical protein